MNDAAALMMRGIAAGYAAETGTDPSAEGRPVLLHVTFTAAGDLDAFTRNMDAAAPFLSNVPGLIWKVWALNAETRSASGTYLFETEALAQMYLSEILPEGMGNVPHVTDMAHTLTPVMVELSRITRAFPMAE